jgi:GTP pyrophosphokinase
VDFDKLADKANMKNAEDMFAALGAGDLRLAQLVNLAQQLVEPERGNEQLELIPRKATATSRASAAISRSRASAT